jgi:hypothetical protein
MHTNNGEKGKRSMKVSELIEILCSLPKDAMLIVGNDDRLTAAVSVITNVIEGDAYVFIGESRQTQRRDQFRFSKEVGL